MGTQAWLCRVLFFLGALSPLSYAISLRGVGNHPVCDSLR